MITIHIQKLSTMTDSNTQDVENKGQKYLKLGRKFNSGHRIPRDYGKANNYFKLAGEAGCGEGYCSLGDNYEKGNGVQQDYTKAHEYYKLACDLGCGEGYRNLGCLYASGYGVQQDDIKAHEYYKLAGELGCGYGYYDLGSDYKYGVSVPQDTEKALYYLMLAYDLGCDDLLDNDEIEQIKLYKRAYVAEQRLKEKEAVIQAMTAVGKVGVITSVVSAYF